MVEPKVRRRYDARRRRAQARQTREAIVDAAERRFLTYGFPATTLATIAADASVSVDTIYKGFGGKAGLVRAIRDRALAGAGPVPAELRSDALHERLTDPHAIAQAWGTLSAEVAPRISPILLLVRDAAAVDPAVAVLRDELDRARLERMATNAARIAPHLRAGVSVEQARDVLWACTSPEMYELLVLRRGWTPEVYGVFVTNTIVGSLL